MPTVSVIIPCFNYALFLPAALESVLSQVFSDWECIIIDDGSTDSTPETAAVFTGQDRRFRYFHQHNRGLPAARNAGIQVAQGEFLQFLDADDLLEANKLEAHVSYLKDHPEIDIVYGPARYFPTENPAVRYYNTGGDDRPWMPQISGKGRNMLAELLKMNIMPVNAPLIRRDIFADCGMFDEALRSHEDWKLWLCCALQGKSFAFFDRPDAFALVRYHQESMSHAKIVMYETNLAIRNWIHSALEDPELKRINHNGCAEFGLALALENLKIGNLRTGAALFLRYGWRYNWIPSLLSRIKSLIDGPRTIMGIRR